MAAETAVPHEGLGKGRFRFGLIPCLVAMALALAAAGGALIRVSADMSPYTDSALAERLKSGAECEPGVPNPNPTVCDRATWDRSMRAVTTEKWHYLDRGKGLIASALRLLAFALYCSIRGETKLRNLRTPRRATTILILLGGAWLTQVPAFWMLLYTYLERGYFARWADGHAMLTHIDIWAVLILLVPLVLSFWLIFLYRSRLPVPLWLTIPGRPWLTVFWSLVALPLFVYFMAGLVSAIRQNAILVPPMALCVWLVLCARAAGLSRHLPRPESFDP